MINLEVGVLGADSLVGECIVPLLTTHNLPVTAFSRRVTDHVSIGVTWRRLDEKSLYQVPTKGPITNWLCLSPIWVLPDYFDLLEAYCVRRIVVLSSTSRFTKTDSGDASETGTAKKLINGEEHLQAWAESRGIEWVILRPTLIYGLGRDKNIGEIARFIRRFSFFPVLGKAKGLRQPIHVLDVASTCVSALLSHNAKNRAYDISGGETIAYRTMVARVFTALSRRPRILTVPLWVFYIAVAVLRHLPRYQQWTTAMAKRMNQDLVFDHTEAARDFRFKPRGFTLTPEDLPQ